MRSSVLSELYQAPVEVMEHRGRIVVFAEHLEGYHDHPGAAEDPL